MSKKISPFVLPINIVQPKLPDLKQLNAKLSQIAKSGWLTNFGPQYQTLRAKLQKYLDVKTIDLFCNGDTALHIAVKSLELRGEVITTPFTFASTIHSIYLNNLTPVFCDIDQGTFNIDPKKIERLITPQTSAILAVHVFGRPCDVDAIEAIAKKHRLKVIYDSAHAFGVTLRGRSLAHCGDISMYSFHATKIFNTIEGGCLVFKDSRLAKKIHTLQNFGYDDQGLVIHPGVNGKMNELQAAVGLLNLGNVKQEIVSRSRIVQWYFERLCKVRGVKLPKYENEIRYNYSYYPILIDKKSFGLSRDELIIRLNKYNIFPRKYFWPIASRYTCYKNLPSARPELLINAERINNEIMCLPIYGNLSLKDVNKICAIIKYIQNEKIKH